jgi:hypothetical protein
VFASNVLAKFARFASCSRMVVISANLDGAECISVHLGSQSFLGDQAVDLVVVWNNRPEFTTLALFANHALERIEDVLKAIIQIEDGEFAITKVESDLDFQLVGIRVLNVALVLDFDDGRVNRTTPLSGVAHEVWYPEVSPVGALKDQPIAEGPTDGVRWDDDPLRACGPLTTHLAELLDEGIRHVVIRAAVPFPSAASYYSLSKRI